MTMKEGLGEDGGGASRFRASTPKLAVAVREQSGREMTFLFFV